MLDSSRINSFLIDQFKKNSENPFSEEIADRFFFRNLANKSELEKLYTFPIQ